VNAKSVWNDSSVSYEFINIRIQKLTAQRPCIIIRFEKLDMAFRLWPSLPSGSSLTQLPLKTKNQKKKRGHVEKHNSIKTPRKDTEENNAVFTGSIAPNLLISTSISAEIVFSEFCFTFCKYLLPSRPVNFLTFLQSRQILAKSSNSS